MALYKQVQEQIKQSICSRKDRNTICGPLQRLCITQGAERGKHEQNNNRKNGNNQTLLGYLVTYTLALVTDPTHS